MGFFRQLNTLRQLRPDHWAPQYINIFVRYLIRLFVLTNYRCRMPTKVTKFLVKLIVFLVWPSCLFYNLGIHQNNTLPFTAKNAKFPMDGIVIACEEWNAGIFSRIFLLIFHIIHFFFEKLKKQFLHVSSWTLKQKKYLQRFCPYNRRTTK